MEMSEDLINDFGWKFFENSKTLISHEDLEGKTIAIDARVWYDSISSNQDGKFCGIAPDIKLIFKQLHSLLVMQIRSLVVFHESIGRVEETEKFFKICVELLKAMSIPYVEVENVEHFLVQLVNNKIVEGCLTGNSKVFLCGPMSAFRYSCFQLEICDDKKPLHLTKFSTSVERSSGHFQCFHHLATFLSGLSQSHVDACHINADVPEKEEGKRSESDSQVQNIRPFMARACKKPSATLRPPQPPKVRVKKDGSLKKEAIDDKRVKHDMNLVFDKLSNSVLGWSENPLDRLKQFKDAMAKKEFDHLSRTESGLINLFSSFSGKSLIDMANLDFKELLPVAVKPMEGIKASGISWERPNFTSLHSFLQTNNVNCSLRHQLSYLVAYDFFQLLKSHISGDSYPEGICRPDRILKISKKNGVEMYTVKWLHIPGTDSLKLKDLVTTELKNTFCAVFPKIASVFEGWNVNSSSDDGFTDLENCCNDFRPIVTPGSPRKCAKNRKRTRIDSTETPASTSSSSGMKATMNQYFVARKKLIFDSIK